MVGGAPDQFFVVEDPQPYDAARMLKLPLVLPTCTGMFECHVVDLFPVTAGQWRVTARPVRRVEEAA